MIGLAIILRNGQEGRHPHGFTSGQELIQEILRLVQVYRIHRIALVNRGGFRWCLLYEAGWWQRAMRRPDVLAWARQMMGW